jgi:hypothetical protein
VVGIHLAILIHARHQLIVALFGFDFVWEPFLEESGEFVIEVFYSKKSAIILTLS